MAGWVGASGLRGLESLAAATPRSIPSEFPDFRDFRSNVGRQWAFGGRQWAFHRGHSRSPRVTRGQSETLAMIGVSRSFRSTPNGIRTRAATLKGWGRAHGSGTNFPDQGTKWRLFGPQNCSLGALRAPPIPLLRERRRISVVTIKGFRGKVATVVS